MEWVETTGRTVDEAKDSALDQLGVDEADAEFEVVEEPRPGLFGRMRGEARVRARVRPTAPRPKLERRDRRRGRRDAGRDRPKRASAERGAGGPQGKRQPNGAPGEPRDAGAADESSGPPSSDGGADAATSTARKRRRRSRGRGQGGPGGQGGQGGQGDGQDAPRSSGGQRSKPAANHADVGDQGVTLSDIDLDQQQTVMTEFLSGLVEGFGLDGTVTTRVLVDDDAIEASIDGGELGLLIGPKGQTLQAVHELTRSVVQRRMPGERHGRIRIDVAGYRERRREALERFARSVADDVLASGTAKALEPMAPPDRKVVHDVVNTIEGVATTSEGEEPRRRVVIRPAE